VAMLWAATPAAAPVVTAAPGAPPGGERMFWISNSL